MALTSSGVDDNIREFENLSPKMYIDVHKLSTFLKKKETGYILIPRG